MLLETVFEQEYAGEPVFEELWTYLNQRQFTFERPVNFSFNAAGSIVQMDALFTQTAQSATSAHGAR